MVSYAVPQYAGLLGAGTTTVAAAPAYTTTVAAAPTVTTMATPAYTTAVAAAPAYTTTAAEPAYTAVAAAPHLAAAAPCLYAPGGPDALLLLVAGGERGGSGPRVMLPESTHGPRSNPWGPYILQEYFFAVE